MNASKFLVCCLVSFILVIAGYVYVVKEYVIIERDVPFTYRQFLLESSSNLNKKVIIESGSNSIHSIDANTLSDYFKAPVVTVSANAGYPMEPKIFNLLANAKAGDLVILPLEWNQYTFDDQYPDNFLSAIADKNLRLEYYFHSLPLYEKFRFLYQYYPIKKAYNGIKLLDQRGILPEQDLQRLNKFEKISQSKTARSYGNSDRNTEEPVEKDGSDTKSCDQYILAKQIENGFRISDTFHDVLSSLSVLKKQGVDVVFTWPAVVSHKNSACYTSNHALRQLPAFAEEIRQTIESYGYQLIGNYSDSSLPEDCFLNTYYHIRKSCAKNRTQKLVDLLPKSNIPPLNSQYRLPDLLNVVSENIENQRVKLTEKVLLNRVPIKNEILNALQLSDKIVFSSGWSQQEKWGIWTLGSTSSFSFNIDKKLLNGSPLLLQLSGRYYNGAELTTINVNGLDFGQAKLHKYQISIPYSSIQSGVLNVRLKHHLVKSPFDLKRGKDKRKIKYGLQSVQLSSSAKLD